VEQIAGREIVLFFAVFAIRELIELRVHSQIESL
jgi:hypothetical protein